MKKHKDYEAIYDLIKLMSLEDKIKLYSQYTNQLPENISDDIIYVDWAMEITKEMAISDGLTKEEMDGAFNF